MRFWMRFDITFFFAEYNMRAAHTKSMHCIQDSMTAYNMRVPHTGCGSCIQYADNAFKIQGPHTICGHRILYADILTRMHLRLVDFFLGGDS